MPVSNSNQKLKDSPSKTFCLPNIIDKIARSPQLMAESSSPSQTSFFKPNFTNTRSIFTLKGRNRKQSLATTFFDAKAYQEQKTFFGNKKLSQRSPEPRALARPKLLHAITMRDRSISPINDSILDVYSSIASVKKPKRVVPATKQNTKTL